MEKSSNKLVDLSVAFAVEILNLVKFLKSQHETIISNQIGRAGTSIGANIHEAQYAHGKPDFIAKLQIALKEANETSYWLLLLSKTNYIVPAEYDRLESLCRELRITLISSINTAKGNIKISPKFSAVRGHTTSAGERKSVKAHHTNSDSISASNIKHQTSKNRKNYCFSSCNCNLR